MEIILKYFADFTEKQIEQFSTLQNLYTHWNNQINVISRKDIDELYLRHVLHSLSLAAISPFNDGARILDLGTGGGFPGIPLAIMYPEVEFHLIDSIGKKIKVVTEVANALKLSNVKTYHSRVEDAGVTNVDFVVSRAVASLGKLWNWSKPLIKKGHENEMANGLLCLKGGDLHQEISESMTRPSLFHIRDIFNEEYFEEKYIVYVPKR